MPHIQIAYLILAHTDPLQLKKLVQSLYVKDTTVFFIHIDAKVNQFIFEKALTDIPNVNYSFIKERVKIHWAGYSICKAETNLMKAALKSGIMFSHFALLSGVDYPLWSNKRIIEELALYPYREWMSVYNLTLIKYPCKIPKRITSYHFRDMPINNPILRHYIVGGLMTVMNYLPIKKKRFVNINDQLCSIYGGSQWWILTRKCVEYVLNILKNNPSIRKYFCYSFAPDELMIQTIIANSSFKEQMISCSENGIYPGLEATTSTHYIKYDGNGHRVFTALDYEKLDTSGKMFCRKVDSNLSKDFIQMIDKGRKV